MNYITFEIKETRDGQFILYLCNHLHQKVYEKIRSSSLDKVVHNLKEEMRVRSNHMTALNDQVDVIEFFDSIEIKYPDAHKETFPTNWNDPLELYGQYKLELNKPGFDLERERMNLMVLLKKQSPKRIWQNRLKLVAERISKRERVE